MDIAAYDKAIAEAKDLLIKAVLNVEEMRLNLARMQAQVDSMKLSRGQVPGVR